jgi:hypothetical protein
MRELRVRIARYVCIALIYMGLRRSIYCDVLLFHDSYEMALPVDGAVLPALSFAGRNGWFAGSSSVFSMRDWGGIFCKYREQGSASILQLASKSADELPLRS